MGHGKQTRTYTSKGVSQIYFKQNSQHIQIDTLTQISDNKKHNVIQTKGRKNMQGHHYDKTQLLIIYKSSHVRLQTLRIVLFYFKS